MADSPIIPDHGDDVPEDDLAEAPDQDATHDAPDEAVFGA